MVESEKFVEYEGRIKFLSLLPKNAICAEFGVYAGRFMRHIIKDTHPSKLYLVDPYWKVYGDKYWWSNKNTLDVFLKAVYRVKKYDNDKCITFVIDTDINFLNDIKDYFFDWIYLDSSHEYEETLKELDAVKLKMKPEGLICGHDFAPNPKHKHHGVAKAINKWLGVNKDYKLYIRDNHSQWIIKRK